MVTGGHIVVVGAHHRVGSSTSLSSQLLLCRRESLPFKLRDWNDATPDVSLTYDAAGRVLTMASSVSALSYTYDDANQLLSETQDIQSPVDLGPKTVSYSYDPVDSRQGQRVKLALISEWTGAAHETCSQRGRV